MTARISCKASLSDSRIVRSLSQWLALCTCSDIRLAYFRSDSNPNYKERLNTDERNYMVSQKENNRPRPKISSPIPIANPVQPANSKDRPKKKTAAAGIDIIDSLDITGSLYGAGQYMQAFLCVTIR